MEGARSITILWVDDEIEHLKAHIFFLKEKGFEVDTASNGNDALEMVAGNDYDLIFLDENMPGISGLETLSRLKDLKSNIPVVMITKSEEENIMDLAIGSKIADYLIKPVNPNQILLTIKKNIDTKRLVAEKTTHDYQSEFNRIGIQISDANSHQEWTEIYKKLVRWELELENTGSTMDEVFQMQKREANNSFARFIQKNYIDWLHEEGGPLMSHHLFKDKLFPLLDKGEKVFFLVIDNFRFDQWQVIKRMLQGDFLINEEMYYSILPTATQYARNAIFSGLMPSQIEKLYPQFWVGEEDDEGKNIYEEQLVGTCIDRFRKKIKYSFNKIFDQENGKKLVDNLNKLLDNQLNVIVFNFVDMLSHARTEMKMIKELASDESAYRSLTQSWFQHSSLFELLKKLADQKVKTIITTDHGTIRVNNPIKVVGDRSVNTNLRYKQGRNLGYSSKDVFEVKVPEKAFLPRLNVSTSYIFAQKDDYFVYPNNYNHYVSYYKDTFQHGGVSLEEMIIPFVMLEPK